MILKFLSQVQRRKRNELVFTLNAPHLDIGELYIMSKEKERR